MTACITRLPKNMQPPVALDSLALAFGSDVRITKGNQLEMKNAIFLILALLSSESFAAYVYCGDKVTRVQIEGGQYLLFLQPESGSTTTHNLGAVGEPLADKYFSMALTAYSIGDSFIIRYTDPASASCSELRWESSKISYITFKK